MPHLRSPSVIVGAVILTSSTFVVTQRAVGEPAVANPRAVANQTGGEEASADEDAAIAELLPTGEEVYFGYCVECHGAEGDGPVVRLAGARNLAYADHVVSKIINGGEMMPAFPRLTDDQVVAVATYVRNSFDNAFGIVTQEDVASVR